MSYTPSTVSTVEAMLYSDDSELTDTSEIELVFSTPRPASTGEETPPRLDPYEKASPSPPRPALLENVAWLFELDSLPHTLGQDAHAHSREEGMKESSSDSFFYHRDYDSRPVPSPSFPLLQMTELEFGGKLPMKNSKWGPNPWKSNPYYDSFSSVVPVTFADLIATALFSHPQRQMSLEAVQDYVARQFFGSPCALTPTQKHAVSFTLITDRCFLVVVPWLNAPLAEVSFTRCGSPDSVLWTLDEAEYKRIKLAGIHKQIFLVQEKEAQLYAAFQYHELMLTNSLLPLSLNSLPTPLPSISTASSLSAEIAALHSMEHQAVPCKRHENFEGIIPNRKRPKVSESLSSLGTMVDESSTLDLTKPIPPSVEEMVGPFTERKSLENSEKLLPPEVAWTHFFKFDALE